MPADMRSDELTLKDLLLLLWGNAPLVFATTLLCGVLATVWVFSERPVYKVDALLQLETKDGKSTTNPLGQLADVFEVSNPAETEIEVIKSRLVLGKAASNMRLDLEATPKGWGRLARLLHRSKPELNLERFEMPPRLWEQPFELEMLSGGRFVLRQELLGEVLHGRLGQGVDSSANPYRVGIFVRSALAQPGQKFKLVRHHELSAVQGLLNKMSVAEVGKKTGIIGLSFEDYDPEQAARILNEIANCYVQQDVEQKSAEAEKTLEFLQEQLPDLKKNLEASEQRLNDYRSRVGSVDLDDQAQTILSQQVDLQEKILDVQQQKKKTQEYFKTNHPNMRTLDSVQAVYQAKAAQQERLLRGLPQQQQEIIRLTRDVQVNTELYTSLLNNAQQLRVVKAGEIGNVRVVDYALPTLLPIKPKKSATVAVGLFLGFVLGAGIVLLRRMLFHGVDDPKAIEKDFSLPVYAMVPHSSAQPALRAAARRHEPGLHVLAHLHPDDLAVESLRSLRTTLQFALADAPNHILVFTGPAPEIGKSFASQNAAFVMAQAGMRTLLVDGDMRRGKLHLSLGFHRKNGLSELLAGSVEEEACLHRPLPEVPLWFVASGVIPPNPSELLHSLRTQELLERWSREFDVVLIDAPPVLAVTDAALFASHAGATLVVLKAGAHQPGEIDAALTRLRQAGIEPKGAIMNDMHSRGGNGSYGYGYGYSYRKDKDAKD